MMKAELILQNLKSKDCVTKVLKLAQETDGILITTIDDTPCILAIEYLSHNALLGFCNALTEMGYPAKDHDDTLSNSQL